MENQFVKIIDGEVWLTFECEFSHDGHKWGFEIMARDWAEAAARLKSLKETARVAGELVERIKMDETEEDE